MGKSLTEKNSVFVVAELSANHKKDYDLAVRTIEAMAASGADAVKVQTYRPDSLTLNLNTGYFTPRKEGLWKGYTPWQLYQEAATPYEWHPKLKKIAEDLGLIFFSSPFDNEAVDFLESMDAPMYKIASFEITDIPLIAYAASKGKPMIISTGIAGEDDIRLAVDTCYKAGNNKITLLKCTSEYPSAIEKANLRTMLDMKERFGVDVGVSDHTLGSVVPLVAVSLGACIVEKHFILDRHFKSHDASFSMEPQEFQEMVRLIRAAESALGEVTYRIFEKDKARRRSLFIVKDIKAGEAFTDQHVRSIRPGAGLHPKEFEKIIGQTAKIDIIAGTPLDWSCIGED